MIRRLQIGLCVVVAVLIPYSAFHIFKDRPQQLLPGRFVSLPDRSNSTISILDTATGKVYIFLPKTDGPGMQSAVLDLPNGTATPSAIQVQAVAK